MGPSSTSAHPTYSTAAPLPSAKSAMPINTIHHVISSKKASRNFFRLHFSIKLMAMPVTICTMPSAIEPIRIIVRSSSGSKRFGSAKTVPGLTMATSCVRKSPKNPPVSAPMMNVLMPQRPSRLNSSPLVPLGRYFLLMMTEAIIMSKP